MASTAPPTSPGDTAFFGHPRGLSTLFFTEMWERFSYYGMRAFLVFFMTADVAKGGLGFAPAKAGIVYGMYTASVYLMSVPGGWIADRFLGLRNAVKYGAFLIMCGHIVLALPIEQGFYIGRGLVVIGTGLLKPNISTIVGQLYGEKDPRRDAGYSIYYMGINIGAFAAPLVCGYLAQDARFRYFLVHTLHVDPNDAWHFGFGAAAVGMAAGLTQYILGFRTLGDAGAKPVAPANAAEASRNKMILGGILAGVVALPVAIVMMVKTGVLSTDEQVGNFFGVLLLTMTVAVFASLYVWGCQNTEERRRLTVILVLFIGAVMFWACFEQAGSVLNLFAEQNTRRELLGMSFPSSWLQSVNSIFVIIGAPMFAAIWMWSAKRGKEPSSPAKFGLALVLVGLGFAVMIPAAMAIDGSDVAINAYFGVEHAPTLVSPGFLVGLYFMHTCAELCLSPVGLSSMSKLAPARWGGLVMGIWFLAASIGNFLAGQAVGYSATMSNTSFMTMMIIFPVALAAVFFLLVKPIGRMLARS
jgi:POT family proton-dependent oligopeptide transporter